MSLRSSTISALALVASLTVAACGGGDHGSGAHGSGDHSSADATAAPGAVDPTIPADADFNAADVAFAQGMIPHHEQAIEMAEMALDPDVGAGNEVKEIAEAIQGTQDPEIELMKGWLAAWGQPEMTDMADHDMSSMEGMMSAADMDRLGTAKGAEFDTLWLQMMVAHHEGAVKMARDVTANGKNPDVSSLADRVIDAQTAEIDAMKALLTD